MEKEVRRHQKIDLALAIAGGESIAAWAQENGVPERTAQCWAQDRYVRREVLVYKRWNFAGKVSFSPTFADARRAFQAAILTRYVVATTGHRARGSADQAAQEPRGTGRRKVPRQFPLIFRISNRSHFSAVPCLSPISATAGITRHRPAKPTRGVVQRGRRSKTESRNFSPCLQGVVVRISEIYPLAITQASWYLLGTIPPARQDNPVRG